MNKKIQNTRNELHMAIEKNDSTQSEKVIEISRKLDMLILDYYKKTMSSTFRR